MVYRPHWSYSQLAQYMRCPLQYFFERIAKLPKPFSASGLVLGSAVHAGLADYHRSLQDGHPLDVIGVRKTFQRAWQEQEVQRPVRFRANENRSQMIDQGIALLETYHREPPPTEILGVELALTVPMVTSRNEILDKPLVAVLDLVQGGGPGLTVIEFKTAGRKFSVDQIETALQATAYAYAVWQKWDQLPNVEYAVLVKTKSPQLQRLKTSRSLSELGRFGNLVQRVERGIAAKAFYPIENPLNCSGCPFRKPCRQWGGPVPSVVTLSEVNRVEEYAC